VEVKNESKVDGEEVVQLYFKDKICKIVAPIRTLLDFKRVHVPANENRIVVFEIPTEKLGYYNQDCKYVVDAGEFEFYISGDGKNFTTARFLVKELYI
jgi:beta-glucosidase